MAEPISAKITAIHDNGFKVEGFRAALAGSVLLGILNFAVSALFGF